MPARPPVSLIGCKTQMWTKLRDYLPQSVPRRTLVPFAGSTAAAACLHDEGHRVVAMSDYNKHFVRVFSCMRKDPYFTERVDKYLGRIRAAGDHDAQKVEFRELRKAYNGAVFRCNDCDRAALAFALWRLTFNGVVKINRKGEYVPVAGISEAKMWKYQYRGVYDTYLPYIRDHLPEIRYEDYRDTFRIARKGDFIYVDPPYEGVINEYIGASPFSTNELVEELEKLTRRGVLWMMTNSDKRDWTKHFKNVHPIKRRTSSYSGGEVVVINYD